MDLAFETQGLNKLMADFDARQRDASQPLRVISSSDRRLWEKYVECHLRLDIFAKGRILCPRMYPSDSEVADQIIQLKNRCLYL